MKRAMLAVAVGAALLPTGAPAQVIAIEGGTVHTMVGAPISNATVLIRDGVIAAVGTDVAVPAGAVRIDARNRVVTPGFFDSGTNPGLVEIEAVDPSSDLRAPAQEDLVAAGFRVADGLNPNSMVIPVTRVAGITTAMSRPQGGLFAGQGAIIDLFGETREAMIVRDPAAMFASLGEAARGAVQGARGGTTMLFREVLEDARAYGRNRESFERGEIRELSVDRVDLEALQPVLAGEIPLVVEAHRASDIRTLLTLAREYGFRPIVFGGTEAWMVAEELARERVPVIVKVLQNLPESFEKLGATYENAGRLSRAGVPVAITTGDTFRSFTLRQEAGNAVAHGMDHAEALRAVTLYPAQIWGIADRYGSLETGKVANVVVWEGDPLELLTGVANVIIRGQEVPLVSRETLLRDRYLRLGPERAY
ncbi:MAG TPA: amidohydrolase family protein [Longimicrobiaceae bacterium]